MLKEICWRYVSYLRKHYVDESKEFWWIICLAGKWAAYVFLLDFIEGFLHTSQIIKLEMRLLALKWHDINGIKCEDIRVF